MKFTFQYRRGRSHFDMTSDVSFRSNVLIPLVSYCSLQNTSVVSIINYFYTYFIQHEDIHTPSYLKSSLSRCTLKETIRHWLNEIFPQWQTSFV